MRSNSHSTFTLFLCIVSWISNGCKEMKLFDDWYKWLCLQFFAQAGFPCPALRNPSDHFLRCINSDFDKVKATLKGSMKLRVFNFSSLWHKFVFQFHYTLHSFNILICAFHQLFSNIHTSANIWSDLNFFCSLREVMILWTGSLLLKQSELLLISTALLSTLMLQHRKWMRYPKL